MIFSWQALSANQPVSSPYQHPLKAESRINLIYRKSADNVTCAGQFKFRLAHNQVFPTAQSTHTGTTKESFQQLKRIETQGSPSAHPDPARGVASPTPRICMETHFVTLFLAKQTLDLSDEFLHSVPVYTNTAHTQRGISFSRAATASCSRCAGSALSALPGCPCWGRRVTDPGKDLHEPRAS